MTSGAPIIVNLPDMAATKKLAATLASLAEVGDVFALSGDLGTGKTEFARAFIRHLSDADEEVPSPTFTIVQTYTSQNGSEIWHSDLYRLEDPDEAIELDLEEAFERAICLIEWPERLGAYLPQKSLSLTFFLDQTDQTRTAALSAPELWRRRLSSADL